ETLKGKIKKALFYPIMVMAVAILVSGILLVWVVPQFEDVFKGFGAELPAFTQLIVGVSRFLVSWWWLILFTFVGAIVGFIAAYKRSPKLQHTMDRLILRVPVIGQIMHNSSIARFARTTAVTFKAGVPLVEALGIVAGATGNKVYEE
ncbi:type II secretion system F family protein, partial [Pelistega suis]|nr:type II secretion system F family protein [Pelistega suis]